jgi:A/G-specific adenine glycosylase
MDLGATLCTPRAPGCLACPWAGPCAARRRGVAAELPRRAPAKAKPRRFGVVFWLERADGAVLLRRRPDDGLLGGMIEVPSTPWAAAPPDGDEAKRHAPVALRWRRVPGEVEHGFTHFDLSLVVMAARVGLSQAPRGLWSDPSEFHRHAMPTLTKKVVRHALGASPRRARKAASGDALA